MYRHHHLHPFPCLHCQPHTYIRMVHNLIERCLLLHMDRDECVKALAEHARIQPLVTITVWKELLKENKDFFQSYFRSLSPRPYSSGYVQRAPRFGRRNQWKYITRRR
ncbi:uncharacterized protein LOC130993621 [Salvia miltiorrhiza]|uniref:uncharacterized protein LOC130993603 n=1 Tax=Salvia miltiorrhiza TaxID=226208 RepID=UPI0025AD2FE0|nr:uncharacterized protein LOC130993603 [Salvia miltiorrhiza]XP_057774555.1 uncharacterized protein LOC130993621 [Salvia miltiorrhiza]